MVISSYSPKPVSPFYLLSLYSSLFSHDRHGVRWPVGGDNVLIGCGRRAYLTYLTTTRLRPLQVDNNTRPQ